MEMPSKDADRIVNSADAENEMSRPISPKTYGNYSCMVQLMLKKVKYTVQRCMLFSIISFAYN